MFIRHAPLETAGRKHECMQQNEHSVVSNSSQEALDRSRILWRCLQLLPSKKLHKAGNSKAQWLRRQNSVGSARASRSSVLLPGPLGSDNATRFWQSTAVSMQAGEQKVIKCLM